LFYPLVLNLNKTVKYFTRLLLPLLIAAWAVHFISPVYYSIAVKSVKEQQRAIVAHEEKKGEYYKITIAESQFNSIYNADEKELKLGNKMYELISFEKKGNNIACTVLYDSGETELNNGYATGLEKERANDHSKSIAFWCPFHERITVLQFKIFPTEFLIHFSKNQKDKLPMGYLRHIVKPPEIA